MATKPPDAGAHSLRSDSQAADESSTKEFGVKPLENFDSTQFPTNFDVLCRYLFERNKAPQKLLKTIASEIYDELLSIYQKGIDIPKPTKMNYFCIQFICDHVNYWLTAARFQRSGRKLSAKQESFVSDLPKMFDIISADAEKQIMLDRNRTDLLKKRDIDFLKDQRNERKHRLGKLDLNYSKKIDAKVARESSFIQPKENVHANSSTKPKPKPIEQMPTRLRPRNKMQSQNM